MRNPSLSSSDFELLYEDALLRYEELHGDDQVEANRSSSDTAAARGLVARAYRFGILEEAIRSDIPESVAVRLLLKQLRIQTDTTPCLQQATPKRPTEAARTTLQKAPIDVEGFFESYPEFLKEEEDDESFNEDDEDVVEVVHVRPAAKKPTEGEQDQQQRPTPPQQQDVVQARTSYAAAAAAPAPPPMFQTTAKTWLPQEASQAPVPPAPQQVPQQKVPLIYQLQQDHHQAWEDHRNQNPFQTAREYARVDASKQPPQQHHAPPAPAPTPTTHRPPMAGYNPYAKNPPPPPQLPDPPIIRESLKRKFQPPKRGANEQPSNPTNTTGTSNKACGGASLPTGSSRPASRGGSGMVTTTRKASTDADPSSDKDDDLPEELQRYGKDLVRKIQDEIIDAGDTVTFSDIAGLEDVKQMVQEVVCWPMKRPDLFTGLRAVPNGLLLFGPPGTGKTLIGKAVAYESGATFFSISSSSLTSKWIGEGEKLVRTLFAVAAYYEPAVVFIDEIDSLLTQRKADDNEASRRIKTEFLVQLDGTGTSSQGRVLLIGATNRPQELDEAARRRFVKRLYIPLPEEGDREVLLKVLLSKNQHMLTEDDIHRLAVESAGFSGADLKSLCCDAAMGPIRELGAGALDVDLSQVPPISFKHFRKALRGTKPSVAPADLIQYLEWDKTYGSRYAEGEPDDKDDDDS